MYCPSDYSPYDDKEDYMICDLMARYCTKGNKEIDAICSPFFSRDIAKVLAFAFQNQDQDAIRVCEMLDLGELEMSAVIDDKKWFEEALLEKNTYTFDWE